MSNEPVRTNLYAAAAIVAVATVAAILGVADEWTPQVVTGAVGAGLFEFAAVAFAAERARDRAWGPVSHADALDERERAVQEGPDEAGGYPPVVTEPADIEALSEPWPDDEVSQ